jgi:hypothetical protein
MTRAEPFREPARFCSHSHEGSKSTGKRRESEIVPCQLVVAGGDATKKFDTTEKPFDDVAGPIQHPAIATLDLSIRTRWDHGLRTRSADVFNKGVRVVALVCDDRTGARSSTSSFAHVISEVCPSVAISRRGRPASSTARCNLVVSPPRERPSACGPFFFELRTNAGVRARWSNRSTHA